MDKFILTTLCYSDNIQGVQGSSNRYTTLFVTFLSDLKFAFNILIETSQPPRNLESKGEDFEIKDRIYEEI